MYYVYVLQSEPDTGLYIGFSTDLKQRLKQHQDGESRATSHRGPWTLIYYEAYSMREDALGREKFMKSGAGRKHLAKQCMHHFEKNPPRGKDDVV